MDTPVTTTTRDPADVERETQQTQRAERYISEYIALQGSARWREVNLLRCATGCRLFHGAVGGLILTVGQDASGCSRAFIKDTITFDMVRCNDHLSKIMLEEALYYIANYDGGY